MGREFETIQIFVTSHPYVGHLGKGLGMDERSWCSWGLLVYTAGASEAPAGWCHALQVQKFWPYFYGTAPSHNPFVRRNPNSPTPIDSTHRLRIESLFPSCNDIVHWTIMAHSTCSDASQKASKKTSRGGKCMSHNSSSRGCTRRKYSNTSSLDCSSASIETASNTSTLGVSDVWSNATVQI